MTDPHRSDVLILGAGHNGLVCAAYLAAAGLKVRMLERRTIAGGAAVTEEFHPGFRNSVASYTVSLLDDAVGRDLRLAEHGLRVVERPYANFLPLPGGDAFRFGGEHTLGEISRFSERDLPRWDDYNAMLERVVGVLRELVHLTPPNITDRIGFADWLGSYAVARRLKHLDLRGRRDLMDLMTKSAGEVLDAHFEGAPLKAVLGWDSIVGNFASPYTPGSAYVLLHHLFGGVNGKPGAWGHAIGGMGAITQAMRKECEARGVVIHTDAPVVQLIVENGRSVGAITEDGREFRARAVASNLNPKLLYQRIARPEHLDEDTRQRIGNYRCGSGTFRMNVALSELPDFSAAPGTTLQPHHQTGILIGPSLGYFEQAYFDAKSKAHNAGWARAPVVEMVISSTLDDTLAPPGQHVASLFCQQVNPEVDGGWDAHRDTVARLMIDTVDAQAPNFARSVLGYEALSPLDLERRFGLVGGDIFHGALGLDQLFSTRPLLGQASYRGALKGLYLCGSGSHPGGGVTGLPGRNAARELLKDWRRL
ncbi:MAG: NAD(P)/FAD-dependent oxidoreductase [Xanthomonadaceae bacterium]|nr:NAD(P)/FAD-dependent oxidoreductase [Xanthomonadaceae bacterium]